MIKLRKLRISYERGRQVLLFLFCLFLAFIIWSIHKLSADYSIYLNYRVHVTTDLQGRSAGAFSNNLLTLKGRASGFYILQQRYIKGRESLYIEVDKRLFKRYLSEDDGYFLLCSSVKDRLTESFGDNLVIENFSVDTLFFNFPRQINRKVPISPKYSASFKNQYMEVGKMKLNPDSVTIYGDYSVIHKLDSVNTDQLRFVNLEGTKNGVVELIDIPGVRFSQNETYYTLEVERYVEKSVTLPIQVINAPYGKNINIFPAEVKMIYRVPFKSAQNADEEKFVANVDYNDIINSINSFVEPKLEIKPSRVLSVNFDPKFVECRIVEKPN